jgi:hypothetical protein
MLDILRIEKVRFSLQHKQQHELVEGRETWILDVPEIILDAVLVSLILNIMHTH